MRQVKLVWILIALMSVAFGDEDSQKHSLKCNMIHLYDDLPGDDDTIAANGTLKKDPSYDELRIELNYLF